MQAYDDLGVNTGPMFCTVTPRGEAKRATISHMDALMHNVLKRLQLQWPEDIPLEVKNEDKYSSQRSLH
ncbi:hypothetical protein ACA910_020076 [Epithemia clementina (nom. ined.)]